MKTLPQHNISSNIISHPSPFLAERIREDSNLEMEWLWAAGKVTDIREQLYCLERALHINPQSGEAQRQLKALARSMQDVPKTTGTVNSYNRPFLLRLILLGTRQTDQ